MAWSLIIQIGIASSLLIAVVVLSVLSSKVKNTDPELSKKYQTAAIVCGVVLVLGVSVKIILYFIERHAASDKVPNATRLTGEAAAALKMHANELNKHADIIKNAMEQMGGVSSMVKCDADTLRACKQQQCKASDTNPFKFG